MQKYVENKGQNVMFVGNTMIPPGEGKLVEVHARAAAPAPAPAQGPNIVELTSELLAKTVAEILLELPLLTNEALDIAERMEGDAKPPRKTLITAIQAERLARADARLQEEAQRQAAQTLHDASDELLAAKVALVNLREGAPDRAAAEARVAEAQARVDALTPAA